LSVWGALGLLEKLAGAQQHCEAGRTDHEAYHQNEVGNYRDHSVVLFKN
jgi:hypothetical protein